MTTAAALAVHHIATGAKLVIPVYVITYDIQIVPQFNSTTVYGRMDPIFSYQGTTRSFTTVVRTPGAAETISELAYKKFLNLTDSQGNKVLVPQDFAKVPKTSTYKAKVSQLSLYTKMVGDLAKMMYPVYSSATVKTGDLQGNKYGTGLMSAAPVLGVSLEGLTYAQGDVSLGNNEVLFVPEKFSLASIVDSGKRVISFNSLDQLRFLTNGSGYTITLGGTILHLNNKVGFVFDEKGNVIFGQGADFPFKTGGTTVFTNRAKAPAGLPTNPSVLDMRTLNSASREALGRASDAILGLRPDERGSLQMKIRTDEKTDVRPLSSVLTPG